MQLLATAASGVASGGFGSALFLAGTGLQAVSQFQQGRAASEALEFEARQREQQAIAEEAAAQQEAIEERRQARFLASRARAVGAASGGGVDLENEAEIAGEGERRAGLALWGGSERARDQRNRAQTNRFEAQQRRRAGTIGAVRTILSGGTTFYERYG